MNNNKSTNSLEEFLIVLREHEKKTFSKFVCIKSHKAFTEAKFMPNIKMKIHWNGAVPHYYIGRRVYACHLGKDKNVYQKKRFAEKRDSKACKDHVFTERRILAQRTKKLNCPVVINVSRVLALPRFKVSKLTHWEKNKMAEAIKKKIEKGEEIVGENVYSFNLPDETSHQNHTVGLIATKTEIIDPKVRSKIKELVSEGKRNISIITALLEQYVVNELGETDKSRSQFYPQRDYIRSIVNVAKQEIRWSKIDLQNIEQFLKNGKKKSGVKKRKIISECNSTISSLQSVMWLLGEQHLEKLRNDLQFLHKDATSHVTVDPDTTLPTVRPNSSSMEAEALYQCAELPKPKKRKESGTVWASS